VLLLLILLWRLHLHVKMDQGVGRLQRRRQYLKDLP
jgi:hypothetical protein